MSQLTAFLKEDLKVPSGLSIIYPIWKTGFVLETQIFHTFKIFFLSINIRLVTFYGLSAPAVRLPYLDLPYEKVYVGTVTILTNSQFSVKPHRQSPSLLKTDKRPTFEPKIWTDELRLDFNIFTDNAENANGLSFHRLDKRNEQVCLQLQRVAKVDEPRLP